MYAGDAAEYRERMKAKHEELGEDVQKVIENITVNGYYSLMGVL